MNTSYEDRPDVLVTLLRNADAATPPPPIRSELPEVVRRTSRRRQHRRVVATGFALVLMAVSAVVVLQSASNRSGKGLAAQKPPAPAPGRLVPALPQRDAAAEYERAKHEAAAATRTANRLLAAERRRQQTARLTALAQEPAPAEADRAASLRGVAAMSLIGQGDRFKTRAHSPLDALASYRRALQLFPDTPWVDVARQRIHELQSHLRNQEIPS